MDRGLHFRRTLYKPGLWWCDCQSCREKRDAAKWLRSRTGAKHEPIDQKNPDCLYLNREQVFAQAWEEENRPRRWLNWGMGILQDLMVTDRKAKKGDYSVPDSLAVFTSLRVAFKLSTRDRVIAATAIQWLGTNVGFSWLCEVLGKCGYEVRKKEEKVRHVA